MKTHALNVYILNDDVLVAGKLRRYLMKRFGDLLTVSLYFNSNSCLKMLNKKVDLVVVDDYLEEGFRSTPGVEIVKRVKEKSPKSEVIILSSNEDVGTAVEAMKNGARDYIRNEMGAWDQLRYIIDQRIKQPIKILVAEFGVNIFMLLFLTTFLSVGLVVWLVLKYIV
jgi:DNA-binding NtrC family response regulator